MAVTCKWTVFVKQKSFIDTLRWPRR